MGLFPQERVVFVYVLLIAVGAAIWYRIIAIDRNVPSLSITALNSSAHKTRSIVLDIPINVVLVNSRDSQYPSLQKVCVDQEGERCAGVTTLTSNTETHSIGDDKEAINAFLVPFWNDLSRSNPQLPVTLFVLGTSAPTPSQPCLSHRYAWIRVPPTKSTEQILEILKQTISSLQSHFKLFFDANALTVAFPAQTTYNVIFHLVVADPENSVVGWDIQTAIDDYFLPFVSKIQSVATVKIETETLFHRSHSAIDKKFQNDERVGWAVQTSKLSSFIDTRSWRLENGENILHLVVYVPATNRGPVWIVNDKEVQPSNAYLLPRWGGVVILEPATNQTELSVSDLKRVFQIQMAQFRTLLGIPTVNSRQFDHLTCSSGICEWEVDLFTRKQVDSLLDRSCDQLQSINTLIESLSVIPVSTEVASQMTRAFQIVSDSIEAIHQRNFSHSLELLRESQPLVKQLLFHHTMIPQLYMKLDHRAAIYAPFFLPFFVKFFSVAKQVIRHRREGGRAY